MDDWFVHSGFRASGKHIDDNSLAPVVVVIVMVVVMVVEEVM